MPTTPLPTPPSRQDPANFAARGDAFLGALPQFQEELNELQTDVATNTTAAAGSASAAASSATAAAGSATSASTSATNAASSATAAASSASSASTSASTATTKASEAATSATNAASSASAAATSDSSASTSASTATTKASEASTSASNAASSASSASTSATNAANSASSASTSATNAGNSASAAATSATAASGSATAAAVSAAAAAAALDEFTDTYLGAKSSDPTVDNDGNPLTVGDQYFNTVNNELRIYNGSAWQSAAVVGGTVVNLTVNNDSFHNGVRVGRGQGNVGTNTVVGDGAFASNSTGDRSVAVGNGALAANTTGNRNTAIGRSALVLNQTGNYNTALGGSALNSNVSGSRSTALGYLAGYTSNANDNTFIGGLAGYSTTGASNTFIGYESGYYVTSGAKNTILGHYNGNQGGLDIRNANNYIVLSDGDGNPRWINDGTDNWGSGVDPSNWANGFRAIELTNAVALWSQDSTPSSWLTVNAYYDSSWKYKTSAAFSGYNQSGGYHTWYSNGSGSANATFTPTQVLATVQGSSLALQGANPQVGTGITFPATQNASSNANTLDDYEEGGFNPAANPVLNCSNISIVSAVYVKIGREVTCEITGTFDVAATATNTYFTINLPFSAQLSTGGCIGQGSYGSSTNNHGLVIDNSSSTDYQYGLWVQSVNNVESGASKPFQLGMTYIAAA